MNARIGRNVSAWLLAKPAIRAFLILLVVALAGTAIVGVGVYNVYGRWDPDTACCDHLFYRSMAYNFFSVTRPELNQPPPDNDLWAEYGPNSGNPYLRIENGLNRQPPFAYRPAVPLLAGAISQLPLVPSINHAFFLISFVSLAGAAAITGLTVFELTKRLLPGLAGTLAFLSLPWAAGANLRDYMLTDSLAFLCLAAAVYFMATGNRRGFLAAALVGIFVKEIVAAVLVAYLAHQVVARRLRISDVFATSGIVGAYLAFRYLLLVPDNAYNLRSTFLGIPGIVELTKWGYATFLGLGLSALIRFWKLPLSRSLAPLALGGLIAALFASNHERALIFGFPFVLIAVLGHGPRDRISRVLALGPVLALPILVVLHLTEVIAFRWQLAFAVMVTVLVELTLVSRIRSSGDQKAIPT